MTITVQEKPADEKRLAAALKRINDTAASDSDVTENEDFRRPAKRIRAAASNDEKERLTSEPLSSESTSPTSWLITGASRGLGLAFAAFLSIDASHVVLATCRDPSQAHALQALAAARRAGRTDTQCRGRDVEIEGKAEISDERGVEQEEDVTKKKCGELHILRLDVEDEASIASAAKEATRILGSRGLGLDYLLNNAGVVRNCSFIKC